jgi:hypothetical protein
MNGWIADYLNDYQIDLKNLNIFKTQESSAIIKLDYKNTADPHIYN